MAGEARGYPAVGRGPDLGLEDPSHGALGEPSPGGHLAVEEYLHGADRVVRLPGRHGGEPPTGFRLDGGTYSRAVDLQVERGPVRDEGAPALERLQPRLVLEGSAGVGVHAVGAADEPVGAGGGGQAYAGVEHAVVDVVLCVHPVGVEQVECVQLAQHGGDRGLHAPAVVAPDDHAALPVGIVAGVDEGRIVRVEGVHERSPADRVNHVADVEQHDVAVPDIPSVGVVAVLLAALDVVVCGGELGKEARSVLVARVLEVPALEDADGRHAEVLDAGVEPEALVWPLLLLVVVEVRIAGMPALERELVPALHPDVGGHHAARRDVQVQRGGGVLGAALGHDPRSAPRGVNLESTVRVEEGRARADLQDRVGWMYGLAGGDEDLDTRRDRLPGRGVCDGPGYLWHLSTLTCVIVRSS